jgi:hypothetical protein
MSLMCKGSRCCFGALSRHRHRRFGCSATSVTVRRPRAPDRPPGGRSAGFVAKRSACADPDGVQSARPSARALSIPSFRSCSPSRAAIGSRKQRRSRAHAREPLRRLLSARSLILEVANAAAGSRGAGGPPPRVTARDPPFPVFSCRHLVHLPLRSQRGSRYRIAPCSSEGASEHARALPHRNARRARWPSDVILSRR